MSAKEILKGSCHEEISDFEIETVLEVDRYAPVCNFNL